jgi:hypothetical protein
MFVCLCRQRGGDRSKEEEVFDDGHGEQKWRKYGICCVSKKTTRARAWGAARAPVCKTGPQILRARKRGHAGESAEESRGTVGGDSLAFSFSLFFAVGSESGGPGKGGSQICKMGPAKERGLVGGSFGGGGEDALRLPFGVSDQNGERKCVFVERGVCAVLRVNLLARARFEVGAARYTGSVRVCCCV